MRSDSRATKKNPTRPARGGAFLRPSMRVALGGIVAALTLGCLALGNVIPVGRVGFVVMASLFAVVLTAERAYVLALTVYVAAGLLSLFVLPVKSVAVLYVAFAGYYAVLYTFVREKLSRTVGWIVKLGVLNAALALFLCFGLQFVYASTPTTWLWVAMIAGAQVVFVAADFVYGYAIDWYVRSLQPRLRKIDRRS